MGNPEQALQRMPAKQMTDFQFRYIPSPAGLNRAILLLHGTGGNETSLLELGAAIDPQAALLSPRGKSLDEGVPRFFRRHAEGILDEADIRVRANELADWVLAARSTYGLEHITALGFSNGANIATSLLLLRPECVEDVIGIRGQTPLRPDPLPALGGHHVLLLNGDSDSIVPRNDASGLGTMLESAGADVCQEFVPAGHSLTRTDVQIAQQWLTGLLTAGAA